MQEHILKGTEITLNKKASIKAPFCKISAAVRRGHEVCGDSAFIYADDEKAIFGVFDGVSGEPSADSASTIAASTVLKELKEVKTPTAKKLKDALSKAHAEVNEGYTTALVLFVKKDGSYMVASVGDSALYSLDSGEIDLEIPLGRIVSKGDTIFRFMKFRNIVKSVVGWASGGMEINIQRGKLSSGNILIAATDCLPDNLEVEVSEFNVEEQSGKVDLGRIIGKTRDPQKILDKIYETIRERMSNEGRKQRGKYLLESKLDDLGIIVFSYSRT